MLDKSCITFDDGTALCGRIPVESVLFTRLTVGFALAGLALTAGFEGAFVLSKAGLAVALIGRFGAENAGLLIGRF